MSNLGWYQTLTTVAKKVGGPRNLVGLVFGAGTIVGIPLTLGSQKLHKGIKIKKAKMNSKKASQSLGDVLFTIFTEGVDSTGLLFKAGGQFRILERDGNAVLIELIGDKKNPYYVSAEFLAGISDFK